MQNPCLACAEEPEDEEDEAQQQAQLDTEVEDMFELEGRILCPGSSTGCVALLFLSSHPTGRHMHGVLSSDSNALGHPERGQAANLVASLTCRHDRAGHSWEPHRAAAQCAAGSQAASRGMGGRPPARAGAPALQLCREYVHICIHHQSTRDTHWCISNSRSGSKTHELMTSVQVPPAQRTAADEQADKLDAMMELTLGHLEQRAVEGQAAGVWATLMASLDRVLLPTQRSKFTQFLLFYAARQVRPRRPNMIALTPSPASLSMCWSQDGGPARRQCVREAPAACSRVQRPVRPCCRASAPTERLIWQLKSLWLLMVCRSRSAARSRCWRCCCRGWGTHAPRR